MLLLHLFRSKPKELKSLKLFSVSVFPGLHKVLLSCGRFLTATLGITTFSEPSTQSCCFFTHCLVLSVLSGHGWLFQAGSAIAQLPVPLVPLTDHGAAHKSCWSWYQLLGNWKRHQEVVFPSLLHRQRTKKQASKHEPTWLKEMLMILVVTFFLSLTLRIFFFFRFTYLELKFWNLKKQ